jgi:hypothetical protein
MQPFGLSHLFRPYAVMGYTIAIPYEHLLFWDHPLDIVAKVFVRDEYDLLFLQREDDLYSIR